MLKHTMCSTCNNCRWFRIRGADASWDESEGKWVPKDIVCRCCKDNWDGYTIDPLNPMWFYVEEYDSSNNFGCVSWVRRRRPLRISRKGEHA